MSPSPVHNPATVTVHVSNCGNPVFDGQYDFCDGCVEDGYAVVTKYKRRGLLLNTQSIDLTRLSYGGTHGDVKVDAWTLSAPTGPPKFGSNGTNWNDKRQYEGHYTCDDVSDQVPTDKWTARDDQGRAPTVAVANIERGRIRRNRRAFLVGNSYSNQVYLDKMSCDATVLTCVLSTADGATALAEYIETCPISVTVDGVAYTTAVPLAKPTTAKTLTLMFNGSNGVLGTLAFGHKAPAFVEKFKAAVKAAIYVMEIEHQHPLAGPGPDVAKMAEKFKLLEYTVTTSEDQSKKDLERSLDDFLETVKPGEDVIFYFSGHGVSVDGTDFMIPSRAPLPPRRRTKVYAEPFLSVIEVNRRLATKCKAHFKVMILDICRTAVGSHVATDVSKGPHLPLNTRDQSPEPTTTGIRTTIAAINASLFAMNTIMIKSCREGTKSFDTPQGGEFSLVLAPLMKKDAEMNGVVLQLTKDVADKCFSDRRMIVNMEVSAVERFYF